jgi:cytoskeleton protein RodZ
VPGKAHTLHFKFDRESWVEVRDGNGNRIFSQLNAAGSERAVSGVPPLSIIVGNASSVHMSYNDEPVDLTPFLKLDVDVARLTLE